MSKKPMLDSAVHLRLPKSVLTQAKRTARNECMTLSQLMRQLLIKALARKMRAAE